jgi:hypothetical protein
MLCAGSVIYGQDQGSFSGDIEFVTKFFIADEEIGAANTPQYDNQLIGSEGWLNLAYAYKGFNVGLRFDMFNNSNLQNPNGSFNGTGIGRWFVQKKVDKLDIQVGFIYDQIGSGIIYRAYEQRPLFIDNALVGARLAYDLGENWTIKGFAGKQKNPLGLSSEAQDVSITHGANIKGVAIDGFIHGEGKKLSLAPGFGVVNRTMETSTVGALQNITALYLGDDKPQVELKYNVYAMSLYNRMTFGAFSWYIEGAFKTDSPIFDPFDPLTDANGVKSLGQFVNHDGTTIYTSLTFAKKGLGILLEAKRTEHFSFRTDPTLGMINGLINYLPPMNRENTYRLTSRYAPAVQDFGELAFQADVSYSFSKKVSANVNFSNITDLNDELLYREIYTEVLLKKARKYQLSGGIQLVEYNQRVFEVKPELTENVKTVTPFLQYLYKLNRKKSLRFEAQYMNTDDDFGSWLFGLVEYGVAPHWVFFASDMYNIDPKKTDKLHYPSAGFAYSQKSNRFQLAYVKQVEGIVCAGGVCRLEPAFSGFRFSLNSTF